MHIDKYDIICRSKHEPIEDFTYVVYLLSVLCNKYCVCMVIVGGHKFIDFRATSLASKFSSSIFYQDTFHRKELENTIFFQVAIWNL